MAPEKSTRGKRAAAEDETMTDAPILNNNEEDFSLSKNCVKALAGGTPDATSFEFTGEDHTLGNALRYIIMKNPKVEFCGYSIPHPSEPKMNIRIQTYEGTALEALEKGLDDLMDCCDVVADKFTAARDDFSGGA